MESSFGNCKFTLHYKRADYSKQMNCVNKVSPLSLLCDLYSDTTAAAFTTATTAARLQLTAPPKDLYSSLLLLQLLWEPEGTEGSLARGSLTSRPAQEINMPHSRAQRWIVKPGPAEERALHLEGRGDSQSCSDSSLPARACLYTSLVASFQDNLWTLVHTIFKVGHMQ